MNDYKCFLISNKPQYYTPIAKSVAPETLHFHNGENCPSFSKLVNSCVDGCESEIVIMMSDKVLPKSTDIKKLLSLIDQGYGFVALYRLAFFGFKKELFRRIGPFDERFVGGGYEDDDYYIRLKEANIGMYVTEEVEYEKRPSSWQPVEACKHFIDKWLDPTDPSWNTVKLHHNTVKRNLPEIELGYNFGVATNEEFLTWDYTFCPPSKGRKYTGAPKIPKEKK